jgi:DNA-binding MarR family transcriptional regulator
MAPPSDDAVDRIISQWAVVRPDLETVPMAVLGRIFRISDAIGTRMERAYAPYGISRGEFDVLATLRRAGDLAPGDLSSALMITSGGITGRLDKLERAGLLHRTPDPDDRRGVRVTLSAEGTKLIDRAVESGLAVQREVLESSLTPRQIEQLDVLLRALMAEAGR